MEALVSIRDLRVDFQLHRSRVPALRGVSFDIYPGSTIALVGESGSGKSVTAQAIMGILPDSARVAGGEILFRNPNKHNQVVDILTLSKDSDEMRAIRGGEISIIFQEPMTSLSPLHTVGDQVSEALLLHRKIDKSRAREITESMLKLTGFPDPHRAFDMYPFELSGGLRQRVMISMALICHPSLLIADEPTTALDVTIQAQILKLIQDLQAELGMAVLIITHDLGVVANLAEEVVVMYHGQIMESGKSEHIFNDPQHPYLQALLKAVPHFDMKEGERLVPVREVKHEVGPMLSERRQWPEDNDQPHLSVRHLVKSYSTRKSGWLTMGKETVVRAVDDVSFDIEHGECFGLVGESGCGKTTLGKLIMRAVAADSGEVIYNDRRRLVSVLDLEDEHLMPLRRKFQFIFQDPFSSLNPRMTVFDVVREPLIIHNIGSDEEQAEMCKELMRLVGLDPRFLNRYPHSFSGGQRQRIGIARALALRPDLIICDEPVSALDVSIQAQVLNLLKDLQAELGLTYLFISHNLAVVDYIAERIAVMCRGRLVEIAPREVLFSDPVHPYTRALLSAVPYADLNRRLDFDMLAKTRVSNPAEWEAPFRVDGKTPTKLTAFGEGHFVRMQEDAEPLRRAV